MSIQFQSAEEAAEHSAFHWEGNSQAALLIHGYPGTPAEMRPVAHLLHTMGWTIHTPLLPGFGAEMQTLAEKTNEDWLHAIEENYLALKEAGKEVVIAGYSMGGALALQLAAKHPPAGLILFAPLYQMDSLLWKALPFLRIIFPTIKISRFVGLDFNDPETREGIQKFIPGADLDDPEVQENIRNYELPVAMFNQIRRTGQLAYQVAQRIQTPTIVFQGTHDDLVKPGITQQLVGRIGAKPKYVEVSGAHDLLNTDSVAWSTIQAGVTRFVNTLPLGDRTV